MGVSYSAYREVGVVLDQEALYDWKHAKFGPTNEEGVYSDEYLDYVEAPHDLLQIDSAGYLMGYDDPIYYLSAKSLSEWGDLWGHDWILEDKPEAAAGLTSEETYQLLAVAKELGTKEPKIKSFWAVSVG